MSPKRKKEEKPKLDTIIVIDQRRPVASRTRSRIDQQLYNEFLEKRKKEAKEVFDKRKEMKDGGFSHKRYKEENENESGHKSMDSRNSDKKMVFEVTVSSDCEDEVLCLGECHEDVSASEKHIVCIDVDDVSEVGFYVLDTSSSDGEANESKEGEISQIYVGFKNSTNCRGEEEEGEGAERSELIERGSVERGQSKHVVDKIKTVNGLHNFVCLDDEEDNCAHVRPTIGNCVAKRTRSHTFQSGEKKKMKGLESLPVHGGDYDLDHIIDVMDTDHRTCSKLNRGTKEESRFKEGKQDICIQEGRRKGPSFASKRFDALNILVESIFDEEEVPSKEFVSMDESLRGEKIQTSLSRKFSLVQEPTTPEKSEYEKELDGVWTEMDFNCRSSEIGSSSADPEMVEDKDGAASQAKDDKTAFCYQGNDHVFILDEEIGVKCKYCSLIKMEIRGVVAPFLKNLYGKSGRKDSSTMDFSVFGDLQGEDSELPGCNLHAQSEGTVWDLIPGIKDKMYPHQREGFEFLWNNIAGGIYLDNLRSPSNGGGGCIISHAPGTGKTLLTIVFLQSYLKKYPTCRPIIVAPCSMLLTWEEEFRKWKFEIPFHNLNNREFSGKENTLAISFLELNKHNASDVDLATRLVKLFSWKSDGGVVGLSYRLFEQLTGGEKKNKRQDKNIDELISKILLELPGLFVLDEGHTPRNDQTLIWKALSKIKTEKRIILSGTPFQNNFNELFNTLCLVRPKFAEKILSSHHQMIQTKRGRRTTEAKSHWSSLTGSIGRSVNDRFKADNLEKVRDMIKPFVHVHKGTILQKSLPGLRHSMVVLRPTNLQKELLDCLHEGTRNMLFLNYFVSLISIHPSLLLECCSGEEKFVVEREKIERLRSVADRDKLQRLRMNPAAGVKTRFVMELIPLCQALNEKVLLFSQYIEPLILIKDQLEFRFSWREGNEILYMDGKLDVKQRQSSINVFNDPRSEARVLLASTRACSEGINLVGGSRVVLLDVTWNPSVERQAISRAYRLGQKKVVYIYHLVSSGTMEEEKCYRKVGKDRMSELVFSSSLDRTGIQQRNESTVPEDEVLEKMAQHEKIKLIFQKIIDQPKDCDLIETFGDL